MPVPKRMPIRGAPGTLAANNLKEFQGYSRHLPRSVWSVWSVKAKPIRFEDTFQTAVSKHKFPQVINHGNHAQVRIQCFGFFFEGNFTGPAQTCHKRVDGKSRGSDTQHSNAEPEPGGNSKPNRKDAKWNVENPHVLPSISMEVKKSDLHVTLH